MAKAIRRVADARADFWHKLSRRLVNENQAIIVENLGVRAMMANGRMSKHIADAGWHMFVRLLTYKAACAGKPVIKVGRMFPSAQLCHACKQRTKLTLSARTWTCEGCGAEHDRDINAAKNIRDEGLRIMAEGHPATVSGRDVRRWRPGASARPRKKEKPPLGEVSRAISSGVS